MKKNIIISLLILISIVTVISMGYLISETNDYAKFIEFGKAINDADTIKSYTTMLTTHIILIIGQFIILCACVVLFCSVIKAVFAETNKPERLEQKKQAKREKLQAQLDELNKE